MTDQPTVAVSGDADHGYIVEVWGNGEFKTYFPTGVSTDADAQAAALKQFTSDMTSSSSDASTSAAIATIETELADAEQKLKQVKNG